jgi:amino-acid N-acetyltransferase
MVSIRRAAAADRAIIFKLVLGAQLDPTSLDWRNFMLAVDDADSAAGVVGCAQIKRYTDCNEFGSLVVRAAARKRGVGALLIEALLREEAGDVYLVCLDKLRAYYERAGFERVSFDDSPRTLRVKQRAGRIFGLSVICMARRMRVLAPAT